MIRTILLFLSTTFLIVGCGEPSPIINETIVEKFIPLELNDSDIFENNKVQAYLQNEVKHLKEANRLILSGLDRYRNEKKLDSAEVYFRQAILKEPSAKAYFELGSLMMDKSRLDSALKAFEMAEKLNYEPFSKILYNKACIYSLQDKNELSSQYIEYAIQAGYSNLKHINSDSDLENVRDTYYFERAIKKGLNGVSDTENLYWLKFKNQFSKRTVPDKLIEKYSYEELELFGNVSYEYEKYVSEMRDEMFSREVGKMFYHYSLPYETEKYVAVIYIVKDEFMGENAPQIYRLATFTHEGKLIDKKVISGMGNLEGPLKKGIVLESGVVEISSFEIEYEKSTHEHGYYNNPIVKRQLTNVSRFEIRENGKIQSVEAGDELVSESK